MADRPATTSKKKKPGRKRRVAGWVLVVIGVLITGVWGASRWWYFGRALSATEHWYFLGGAFVWRVQPFPAFVTADRLEGGWFASRASPYDPWKWLPVDYGAAPRKDEQRFRLVPIVYYAAVPIRGAWGSPRTITLQIILWPFALVSLLGGGWLVWSGRRAKRRAMTGVCLKCGYDLAGLAAGAPCPECGGGDSRHGVESTS